MRRWTAAMATACGCTMLLANVANGCSSFEETNGPTESDAASEATTPSGDATTPIDGGATVDADGGGPSFCALVPASELCDDFEQAGRDLSAKPPWDMSSSTGPQVRMLGPGNDSPNGLHVTGVMVEPNETRLSKLYSIVAGKVRLSMDVKIDKLTKSEDGGVAHFGVAAVLFPNGRELVLFLNATAAGDINGFAYSRFADGGGDTADFATSALQPKVKGGFFKVAIEFDPIPSGTDQFRFYLGITPSPVLTINVNPPSGDSVIAVGARGGSLPSDLDVTIDNVLVEKR